MLVPDFTESVPEISDQDDLTAVDRLMDDLDDVVGAAIRTGQRLNESEQGRSQGTPGDRCSLSALRSSYFLHGGAGDFVSSHVVPARNQKLSAELDSPLFQDARFLTGPAKALACP